MPVIPTLGRLRQEDCEYKVSLGNKARFYLKKIKKEGRGPCALMPLILATQEIEIWRQPRQKVHETPSQPIAGPSYCGEQK
jgi:hypothetical protein